MAAGENTQGAGVDDTPDHVSNILYMDEVSPCVTLTPKFYVLAALCFVNQSKEERLIAPELLSHTVEL